MENNLPQPKRINYKFWKDSKMMGMILLIATVTLQIFAFMRVPVLSTINAYTVGMIMGAANPFFYVYVAYIALTMIFKDSTKLPSWVKVTKISYWFVAVSVVFIISATGHYQTSVTNGWTSFGTHNFDAMTNWFDNEFTAQSAWYPGSVWGGVLGSFLFSFFSMIFSGIGSFILSIGLVAISISVLVTGTGIGLYKGMIKKRNMDLAKKEIKEEEKVSFDNMKEIEGTTGEGEDDFPFEDPFA